jgi:hypothetical protein
MAEAKKVKVQAFYDRIEPTLTLWGVIFLQVGEGDKAKMIAEVDAETAKSLIDAKRAVKV